MISRSVNTTPALRGNGGSRLYDSAYSSNIQRAATSRVDDSAYSSNIQRAATSRVSGSPPPSPVTKQAGEVAQSAMEMKADRITGQDVWFYAQRLPLPFSLPILPIPLPRCIPSDPPSHFCVNSRPNLFIRAGHHRNQKVHEHDVENEKGQDEKHERSVIVELMQVEVAERLHGGASQRERTSRVERIYTVSTTSSQRDSEKLQR